MYATCNSFLAKFEKRTGIWYVVMQLFGTLSVSIVRIQIGTEFVKKR
jgi:hypothetical protein